MPAVATQAWNPNPILVAILPPDTDNGTRIFMGLAGRGKKLGSPLRARTTYLESGASTSWRGIMPEIINEMLRELETLVERFTHEDVLLLRFFKAAFP